ncbi:filamentous hemagglutinin N-terminal domain-containing protein [Mitsuokella sp. AF21-1AC]|uniref:two-partner secretion domain-containing protein n=1 Tax=Mitsuokella sp. AF21-1AC TaxID=2292235 RepID=UPI000E529481|nr:filamentous hemagglutinin N-terminal domain-containing protein [Mitsuokella sp. AF21-1AC]RGS70002.1 filamentous hemagglutinin N-terminal domain-containing protein [Mitsuokella sp. AF21-1AC]
MERKMKRAWQRKTAAVAAAMLTMSFGSITHAMPQGDIVRSGEATIQRSDDNKNMEINQSTKRVAIDWKNFDIANDERVNFRQPDAQSIALNRVTGDAKSVIDGQLTGNGQVFVVNPNGVLFGQNASVDVGSLVASTARVSDAAMAGFGTSTGDVSLAADDANTSASVINEGQIKAEGGLVALHAASVANNGTITNEGGRIALAAAKTITLSADTAGKINFDVDGKLAKASTLNTGVLRADGGYVVMTAKQAGDVMSTVVNNTGTIEAKTLRQNEKGEILLDGGNNGVVEVSGTIDASGLENNQSAGSIKVIGNTTTVHDGTNLLARGTIDGGKIETSGDVLNLGSNLNIDAKGINGSRGEWLLDPLAVYISDDDPTQGLDSSIETKTLSDSEVTSNTRVAYNDPGAKGTNTSATDIAVTWIKGSLVNTLLNAGTDVTIQAAAANGVANIILNSEINPTVGDDEATFTLEANRNITINKPIDAQASGGKLNVILNSNTNNDGVGAVIINADINTNGGFFTSASGGVSGNPVKFTGNGKKGYGYGTYTGQADHTAGTIGTYFGNLNAQGESGALGNRSIITKGGAVTLNGEVAIGLNGGTLNIDTNDATAKTSGAVTVTGLINSGNSYTSYIEGGAALTNLFKSLTDPKDTNSPYYYLTNNIVPAYKFIGVNYVRETDENGNAKRDSSGNYIYKKDSNGNYIYTYDPYTFANGEIYYNFHTITASGKSTKKTSDTEINSQHTRWYTSVSDGTGKGYRAFIMEKGSMSFQDYLYYLKVSIANFSGSTNPADYTDAQKLAIIEELMINNWFVAADLAKGNTGGGSAAGDTYLATITTRLENSLTAPDYQLPLYVGGRGSGIRGKNNDLKNNPYNDMPVDPTYQSGFYWVTGPEGEANNNTGILFYDMRKSQYNGSNKTDTKGSEAYGFSNWSSDNAKSHWQPDDSSPFLTVGYGGTGMWDDASIEGGSTVGFVQEKNLAHSNLNIQAGSGIVKLQGNIGGSEKLDTVTIHTTGNVTIGGSSATDYNMGTINTDHGIDITGADVTIGGRMTSGSTTNSGNTNATDNITTNATGDITVHGITSSGKTDANGGLLNGGKISLTSTKSNGIITLTTTTNKEKKDDALGDDGTLTAASGANDAVVIDAQGTSGSFVNATSQAAKNAITTGTGGSWKIYSASPDLDTFGTNLNSGTDAMWTSKSNQNTVTTVNAAGVTLSSYATTEAADENASGKYIFQTTPTITISADNYTKVYGDTSGTNTTISQADEELTSENMYNDLNYREEYTKSDGKTPVNVSSFSNAFQEKDLKSYIDGTVTVSSRGSAADATRTNGDTAGTDKNKSIYNVDVNIDAVGLNGHLLKKENGTLIITPKALTVSGTGEQTYGNSTITKWTDTTTGTLFGAKVSYDNLTGKTPTIKTDSSYDKNRKTNHPNGSTADASDTVYQDALDSSNFSNIKISDAAGNDMSANYTVTTTGDLKVNKADITLNLNDVKTTYGKAFDTNGYGYDHNNIPVLNGDDVSVITDNLQNKDLKYTNTGDGTNGRTTQDAGRDYKLKADDTSLGNYNIHFNDGDSVIEKAKLSITTPDITTEYGTVTPGSGSSLTGLTNGDENDTTGLVYDYTYGNGYLDNDTRTNNLGDYTVTTDVSGKDYLKNYEITPGKSNLHIDPKDVYVRVYGKGNTTQDITYVDPDIDSKLSYGDHATWTPNLGDQTGEFTYDVITDINGHPFKPGESEVIGNYRFHYDGVAVVSPSKPDIDPPVVPPVVPGNGGYTLPTNPQTPSEKESGTVEKDWGTRDEGPGIDRERHIIKVQLPFFKIDDGKMTNYGTYDVKSQAAKVDISPTGKRLPEPNQPKTQYREYTKDITTSTGTGEFRLIYNGSTFHVMPLNAAARTMMQTGDEKHNVDLFAQALHIGFSEMGILPADLDGVYANFQDIAADAQNNSK